MKIRARNKRSIAVVLAFMVTWICLGGLVSQAWALPTIDNVYSNVYAFAGNVDPLNILPPQGDQQSAADGEVDATWQASVSICPAPGFCIPGGSSTADAHADLFPDVSVTSINAAGLASVTTTASGSSPFPGVPIPSLSYLSAIAQSTLSVDFTLDEATSYNLEVDALIGATLEISSGGTAIVSASQADVGSVLNGLLLPGNYSLFAQADVSALGNQSLWERFDFSLTWTEGTEGTPVPEPCTILLVGTGLIGLAGFRRRFRK